MASPSSPPAETLLSPVHADEEIKTNDEIIAEMKANADAVETGDAVESDDALNERGSENNPSQDVPEASENLSSKDSSTCKNQLAVSIMQTLLQEADDKFEGFCYFFINF